jgi:phosphohistidine phosphatase
MKLYLVQHAKAASKQVDPERPLTEQGRQDIQKVATFIKSLNLSVDYLWHSKKKRSIQTADTLAEVISIKNQKNARDGLAPNDNVADLRKELNSMQQDVMIVGHLPFLSNLASLLLAGTQTTNIVEFKQGGIVSLSRSEDDQWQIDWMVTPDILT